MNTATLAPSRANAWAASPVATRSGMVLVMAGCAALALFMTSADASRAAVLDAGADLTRLLRAMAALKAMMAAGVAAAVIWRLGVGISLTRFAAYALACGAMTAGPVLIWFMVQISTGAFLLHAGLLAAVLLLWRDPDVTGRMAAMLIARRAALHRRP